MDDAGSMQTSAGVAAAMTANGNRRAAGGYFRWFAAVLIASMAVHFAVVYNFQFFAFYDPGTAFHGLALLDKGYVPTVDFGYTHGLLSLEFSRAWMGVFGRTPGAFVAAVVALQLVIAWGLARLAVRFALSRRGMVLFCLLLPWAVIPDYLTLTHPLEAALLVHALAEHAAERRSRALAILTATLFVKPSMAYVYGLILVIWMVREAWTREDLFTSGKIARIVKGLVPAAIVGAVAGAFVLWRYGVVPVKNTLFAVAGVSAYKETNFGLFLGDGREFWLPTSPEKTTGVWAADFILHYLTGPAAIWLIAVLVLILVGGFNLMAFWKNRRQKNATTEVLVTLALLHTAFLLLFYGWKMSWTYYAYMPLFALAAIISRLNVHRRVYVTLVVLGVLCHMRSMGTAMAAWFGGIRTAETSGLFAWGNHATSFREVLTQTAGKKTLLMTNGYPFDLPPNVTIPDAWFPEAGIATPAEVTRVREQALASEYVIVFWHYGVADLWNTRQFADVRARFERVKLEPPPKYPGPDEHRNSHFEIWQRIK